jgi:hypothetical protein
MTDLARGGRAVVFYDRGSVMCYSLPLAGGAQHWRQPR